MYLTLIRTWLGFAALVVASLGGAQAATPTALAPPAEAEQLIQKVWGATLRTCGQSAFESLGGRVLIELDQPQYHFAPTKLTEAATSSGYQFQGTAVVSARRWRWAHQTGGAPKWTAWQEGQDFVIRLDEFGISPAHTLIEDGVLQFDLIQKDGVWKAYYPLSPLNSEIHDFDLKAASPSPKDVPACSRLSSRG